MENRIDKTPQEIVSSALQELPFENLIGGPLKACIKAQEMATNTTMRFINEVGFTQDEDGDLQDTVMVSFFFQQNGRARELLVPLLTLVPIPFIGIDTIDISFKARVTAFSKGEVTARFSNVDFKKDSKYDIDQSVDVKVHASSDSMPAGLAKILDVFSNTAIQIDEYISPIRVLGVSIDEELSIQEGDSATLAPVIEPENAENKKVKWESSDETIVTINDTGTLAALKVGNATIVVTTVDRNKKAKCKVTVTPIPVSNIILNKKSLTLKEGSSGILQVIISPASAKNKNVTWQCSNAKVATVNDKGAVTAISVGYATITAKTEDGGIKAKCRVKVNPVPVASVSLNRSDVTLIEGASDTLVAVVSPDNAKNKNIKWESSDENVATVDDKGKVTARQTGKTNITVTTKDREKKATCAVTISLGKVSVNGENMQSFELGKLSNLFKSGSKEIAVKSLVFGQACINGTDVNAIKSQHATLETLNMLESTIVEGGTAIKFGTLYTQATPYVIGDFMFYGMSQLKTVLLPKNTLHIRRLAFHDCPKISSYNIPEGVKYFKRHVFSRAIATSVNLPASLNPDLSEYGFKALGENISSISVASANSSIKSVSGVVYSKDGKKLYFFPHGKGGTFSVPSGVIILKKNCFSDTKLTTLTLPASLTTIESYAISFSKTISSLTIPVGVTQMGSNAIYNNSALKKITVLATKPPACSGDGSKIINALEGLEEIFVPAASVNAYKSAPGWSEHAAFIKAIK